MPNVAHGYRREGGEYYYVDRPWLSYGDGGIIASLSDMLAWEHGLSAGELVSRQTLELALASGVTSDGAETGYGFGWQVTRMGPCRVAYHNGGDPGFGSLTWRIPGEGLSVTMLSNLDGSWRHGRTGELTQASPGGPTGTRLGSQQWLDGGLTSHDA